jgi:hypothetical protein
MSHIGRGLEAVWLAFLTPVGCMLEIKVQGGWATKKQFQKILSSSGLNFFF